MPIQNDDQLTAAALRAGQLLQEIQNYLGHRRSDLGKVRFPRGFLTPVADRRRMLPRLGTDLLARNVSYAYMTLDVFRWLATRTDLSGQAFEMIVKEAICLMGNMAEALITRRGVAHFGKNNQFKTKTTKLVERGVIRPKLKADLDWIWDVRCREHLADVSVMEWGEYSREDHNRARSALDNLVMALVPFYAN